MGCCKSKQVLSQVSAEPYSKGKPGKNNVESTVKADNKDLEIGDELAKEPKPPVAVIRVTQADDIKKEKDLEKGKDTENEAPQQEFVQPPGMLPEAEKEGDEADKRPPPPSTDPPAAATAAAKEEVPEAPKLVAEPLQPAAAAVAPTVEEPKPATAPEAAKPATEAAEPEPIRPLKVVPLDMTESEIGDVFAAYSKRIPANLARTIDCSWQKLADEMKRYQEGKSRDALQWFWLLDPSKETDDTDSKCAEHAWGLAVVRLESSKNLGQVCHLSITAAGEQAEEENAVWRQRLPGAIAALRTEMMTSMPINAIAVTLWHEQNEEKLLVLDKETEKPFKEAGYRWFQLTNTSDGKRGQVMRQRRMTEENGGFDPTAPEEIVDLRFSTCLLVPYCKETASGEAKQDAAAGSDESSVREQAASAGNGLVMAECLRRHVLQQKVPRPTAKDASSELRNAAADADGEAGSLQPSEAVPESKTALAVNELITRLSRRKSLPMVRSTDTDKVEDCNEFTQQCLVGLGHAGESAEQSLLPVPLPSGATAADGDTQQVHRVLCGGLALGVNWKSHWVQLTPRGAGTRVRVPVHATGKAALLASIAEDEEAKTTMHDIAYLATEDENIFIIVWKLPEQMQDMRQEDLYPLCQRVLKEAPPEDVEDARAVEEVVLPRFNICAKALASVPSSLAKDHALGDPRELLAAKLSTRPKPRGALKSAADSERSASEKAMVLDGPFVMCVYHGQLDDLEFPLFAVRISPDDWTS
eukprot:TRINITY_DN39382_c0_g1_i1.p1 TRINITY_DN39382_c0_g1~~TRINITY_DN39382_c0_g1_i1.p1  ORF type:complete len:756 (+),score=191.95 TRINITY_DN39382_c0_g1_i1:124-2391(+)